ncbi:MAG TPA: sulfur carrier protein ThiS [Azospirillaceae bacterium]|nr:sulfur carrier protein ThiS [Azospirillaceae bacterium]
MTGDARMMKVNGKPRDRAAGPLLALLAEEGVAPDARGVAVAVNGAVVPRARWGGHALAEGDEIEIVKVLQGG